MKFLPDTDKPLALTEMDHAKKAAAVLDSDPVAAVVSYTKALIEHPTSPDYYTQRSVAFTRSRPPRHDLALQDAELAVLCGQKRGKRDKIQAGQQRRVVSYYNLGRYADAKLVLEAMKKWRPKESKPQQMEHDMWSTKINRKLENAEQNATTEEYPTQTLPSESVLSKDLKKQIKADGSYNYGGEDVEIPETKSQQIESKSSQLNNLPATVSTTPAPPQKIRHEWYQNSQAVILTIYAKGVQKERVETDIQEDSVSVSFPHPSDTSSLFNISFDPLYALVDTTTSKATVMSTKIELTLQKQQQGQKWGSLEGNEPLKKSEAASGDDSAKKAVMASITQLQSETAPSYPTSSKSGPKNWDKVANDLTVKKKSKKDKKKDDPDSGDESDGVDSDYGGDAVDGFFKKLYAGADDDTRRAMMKSFSESNGTALSTNWSEVGSKKVEEVKSKDEE